MEQPPAKKLKLDMEKKRTDGILAEFTLLNALTCSIERGKNDSLFFRLSRGSRWIVLSTAQWMKLVEYLPKLDSSNACLKLTADKDIKIINFNEKRFVSFHRAFRGQRVYDTYINMNEQEWKAFKTIVPDIVKAMPNCSLCQDVKVKRRLFDDRMLETKLSPKRLVSVKEDNEVAYNQMAYQCEYCGQTFDYEGTCHCHRYNCRECEPDNFCKQCGDVTVAAL